MMTTPIPKACLEDIEKLERKFIWGDTDGGRKLHLIGWDTLTLPKAHGGLGIRSLVDMNKACLMKLAWNLRPDADKLWSRVLIGKYGRNNWHLGDLDCKASDSYIWKAIHSCWGEIKSQEVWAVGDGVRTSFWWDRWLYTHSTLAECVDSIPAHLQGMRVVDLVDAETRWRWNELHGLLPKPILNKLLAYPVPDPSMGPDMAFWPGETSGMFSVASAYQYLHGDGVGPFDHRWKEVWRIDAPERVRYFAWQILHGKLATKAYCNHWNGGVSDCFSCPGVSETILHVLRDCPLATAIWRRLVPYGLRSGFYGSPFGEWVLLNLFSSEGPRWKALWASACYFLWSWRNKAIHDPNFVSPHAPDDIIRKYVDNYFKSKNSFNPSSGKLQVTINVAWKPSSGGGVTINTDGASKDGGMRSGCGGVIRDGHGSWLGGFTCYLGEASAFTAELWGAYHGLQLARDKGFTNVELQIDSQVVIASLNGATYGPSDGRCILMRVRKMLALDWHVTINHIYREANSVADGLASLACHDGAAMQLLEDPPDSIVPLLHADCNGVFTPRNTLV